MKFNQAVFLTLFLLPATAYTANVDDLQARAARGELTQVLQSIDHELSNGENRDLHFLKARLLADAGRQQQAIQTYRKLIARYPKQPEPYNNLAALLAAQGKLKEAQQLLEQAMATHPSYAAIYENLSVVFVELARDSYGKALRIKHSDNQLAMTLLDTLAGQPTSSTTESNSVAAESQSAVAEATEQTSVVAADSAALMPRVDIETRLESQLESTLQAWADAWSQQAVGDYLGFYASDYRPSQMGRRAWQQQRQDRLSRPAWIKVELSDFELTRIDENRATVKMTQVYRSDTYQDRTRKRVKLRRGDNGWRIVEETTLTQMPL